MERKMVQIVEYDINYKTESWFELVSDNVEENWFVVDTQQLDLISDIKWECSMRSHYGYEITDEGKTKIIGYFTDGDKDISEEKIMELYNITKQELENIKRCCIDTICELIIEKCNETLWQDLEREWLD